MKLTAKTLGVGVSLLCVLCTIPVGWAAYSAAMYLMTDTRFEVQKLLVSGVKRVEESQVSHGDKANHRTSGRASTEVAVPVRRFLVRDP